MSPRYRRIYPKNPFTLITSLILCFTIALSSHVNAEFLNGFDLSDSLIPENEILSGGPPKDGIPAINTPKFLTSTSILSISDSDRVLGIRLHGISKAYPIKILNWHEIVNDTIEGTPFVVTYCPLCGTGMAFSSKIGEINTIFGVSGLLYNSDVLLYDRKTNSLWSQLLGKAVSGPMLGEHLTPLPLTHTTWGKWRVRYPASLVLSENTGFKRDYTRNPYLGYKKSRSIYFPVKQTSDIFHPKELVLGVEVNGRFKAYPFSELKKSKKTIFNDNVNGRAIKVTYQDSHDTAEIFDKDGRQLPAVTAYWFAWYAFHPETEVFRSGD